MQKDSSRRRFPLADRVIEVIDDTLTGEVLLDETLKMMKSSEKMSVNSWIDLLSGTYILLLRNCDLQLRYWTPTRILFADIVSRIRRDMEPDEDRLPTETSARASSKGSCGQGHFAD